MLASGQPGKRRVLLTWYLTRRVGAAVAAAGITAASLAAMPAASASSTHWGTIEGIGGVNVRALENGVLTIIGHAGNQDSVTVYCYIDTSFVVNGDYHWDELSDPNGYDLSNPGQPGVFGYVADAYVYTAGDITKQVPRCNIPPG